MCVYEREGETEKQRERYSLFYLAGGITDQAWTVFTPHSKRASEWSPHITRLRDRSHISGQTDFSRTLVTSPQQFKLAPTVRWFLMPTDIHRCLHAKPCPDFQIPPMQQLQTKQDCKVTSKQSDLGIIMHFLSCKLENPIRVYDSCPIYRSIIFSVFNVTWIMHVRIS